MAGTKAGGVAAAKTNKAKYGEDFYKLTGKKGGSAVKTKPHGFLTMTHEQRVEAGRKGGTKSRRGPSTTYTTHSADTIGITAKVQVAPLPKPKFYQLKYRRNLKRLGIR